MFTTKGELDAMGCSRTRSAATRSSTPSRSSTRANRFHPTRSAAATALARVIETMRAFDAVPAGMKMEPESVCDNRFVLKALAR